MDVTYIVPSNITFRQPEELVALGARLHDFFQRQVHVGVAGDQVAVERFAVFELHQHWVALGGVEEAEGELGTCIGLVCVEVELIWGGGFGGLPCWLLVW